MRRVLLIIIVAAITVALAWWIAGLPGHIDVTIAGTTVDASAPVAMLGLIILVAVIYIILRFIAWLLALPMGWSRMRARSRRKGGDSAVTQTLVAIAAGDRGDARKAAARARRLHGDTPQTLLLAAEASRLAGDEAGAAEIYRKLAEHEDAGFLGLRGLFRQAVAREDWAEASQLAQRADRLHPGASWLREERAQLAVKTRNWSQAAQLAAPGTSTVAFTTAASESEADPKEAMRLARQAFKEDPGFAPAALAYARRLRADGKEQKVTETIGQAWKANPNPELAEFALVPITEPAARLRAALRIIGGNVSHPETLLLLSRLNLEAGQIGDARHYAESLKNQGLNQRRLWVLLADIEAAQRGDTESGRLAQRDALRHAAAADPDPGWRCEACGAMQAAWHPSCPACSTAGRINWGPPRVAVVTPVRVPAITREVTAS